MVLWPSFNRPRGYLHLPPVPDLRHLPSFAAICFVFPSHGSRGYRAFDLLIPRRACGRLMECSIFCVSTKTFFPEREDGVLKMGGAGKGRVRKAGADMIVDHPPIM